MANVSLFEDVRDRLQESLSDLEDRRRRAKATSRSRTKLAPIVEEAKIVFKKLNSLLLDATSPDFQLAIECDELREQLAKAKKEKREVSSALEEARALAVREERKYTQLRKEFDRLQRDHDGILRQNPKTAYDFYSTKGRLAKNRPSPLP